MLNLRPNDPGKWSVSGVDRAEHKRIAKRKRLADVLMEHMHNT